uniref:Solute carrier family 4 member 1 adaptor protein n=1 Tax=Latimeria chalumnae TaxID=7897 RepID=H3A567_LATCH
PAPQPPVRQKAAGPPPACPPLPYQEPAWGGPAEPPYVFEVLKNGVIVSTVKLNGKSFHAVGRLPVCDVVLEHPSISRYHAVVQYRGCPDEQKETGFYLYDLGSTHGTFLNKTKIPPKTYLRLRVGHVVKFGGSTRLFVLQGPEDDQEAELDMTVTQLKELRKKQQEELEKKMLGEDSDEDRELEEEADQLGSSGREEAGCTWGIGDDAVDDEADENPFAMEYLEEREASYMKDPKKALQGFYDREGEELEYEYDSRGPGIWLCRVRLPVEDLFGKPLVAEVVHAGRKKEAMIQCALEACRILDSRGVLRQEAGEGGKKSSRQRDPSDFTDEHVSGHSIVRASCSGRSKQHRNGQQLPFSQDALVARLNEIAKELEEVEEKLKSSRKGQTQSGTEDSLEAFMTEIKSEAHSESIDSVARKKLHLQSFELKKEQQTLQRLVKIAKPAELPQLQAQLASTAPEVESKPKKVMLPMFGAMKGGSKFKLKTGAIG